MSTVSIQPATRIGGALLWLALSSSAQAACQVTQMTFDLPPYIPTVSAKGQFQVKVQCDASEDTYQLELMGVDGMGGTGLDALQVRLSSPGTLSTLAVMVHGARPLFSGALLQGSQNLRFPVTAEANQWIGAGEYAAQVWLTLKSIDSTTSRSFLDLPKGDQP